MQKIHEETHRIEDKKKKKDAWHAKFRDGLKRQVLDEKCKVEKRVKKDKMRSGLKAAFQNLVADFQAHEEDKQR